MKGRICDRCSQPITNWDEMLQDQIDREYPNRDICPNCDEAIKLATETIKANTIKGAKPGTTAKEMLQKYSEPTRRDHRIR